MKLINKDVVVAMIKKIFREGYQFLPSDLVESAWDYKDDLLRALDDIEEKELGIEYVRKDFFIEKTIEWLNYYTQNGGCELDGWEEDFRQEMETTE